MRSQVTTKRGDDGNTVTLGGEWLPKSHPILESCGCVDSLRAQTALCRALLLESGRADREELADFLLWLLHVYFLIGSQCNDPRNLRPEYRKLDVSDEQIKRLEQEQASVEAKVRLPRSFTVAASNALSAQVDVACTEARRLERSLVRLAETVPEFDAGTILVFVNRLSDYLYMVARLLEDGRHETVDYGRLGYEG